MEVMNGIDKRVNLTELFGIPFSYSVRELFEGSGQHKINKLGDPGRQSNNKSPYMN